MGLVTTMGNYCFVACDGSGCNKKIEHIDARTLKQLVKLCGWERREDLWLCADCSARIPAEPSPETGHRRSPASSLKTNATG